MGRCSAYLCFGSLGRRQRLHLDAQRLVLKLGSAPNKQRVIHMRELLTVQVRVF
jgi:hypothetical protein